MNEGRKRNPLIAVVYSKKNTKIKKNLINFEKQLNYMPMPLAARQRRVSLGERNLNVNRGIDKERLNDTGYKEIVNKYSSPLDFSRLAFFFITISLAQWLFSFKAAKTFPTVTKFRFLWSRKRTYKLQRVFKHYYLFMNINGEHHFTLATLSIYGKQS